MTAALFRPRPACAEGRREIRARMQELVAEAEELEQEHQVRAARMGEIRRELTMLRDASVHIAPGVRPRFRKARVPGPAPVGRPAPPAVPVRGRHLRYAALGVLLRARRPMTLPEIHRGLHAAGFAIDGWHPVKQLADALGWEHEKKRARRVARGVYEVGQLSAYRRRRALREAERVPGAQMGGGSARDRPAGTPEPAYPQQGEEPGEAWEEWGNERRDECDRAGAAAADEWRVVGVRCEEDTRDERPP